MRCNQRQEPAVLAVIDMQVAFDGGQAGRDRALATLRRPAARLEPRAQPKLRRAGEERVEAGEKGAQGEGEGREEASGGGGGYRSGPGPECEEDRRGGRVRLEEVEEGGRGRCNDDHDGCHRCDNFEAGRRERQRGSRLGRRGGRPRARSPRRAKQGRHGRTPRRALRRELVVRREAGAITDLSGTTLASSGTDPPKSRGSCRRNGASKNGVVSPASLRIRLSILNTRSDDTRPLPVLRLLCLAFVRSCVFRMSFVNSRFLRHFRAPSR